MKNRVFSRPLRVCFACACAIALLAAGGAPAHGRPEAPAHSYGAYVLGRLAEACGFGAGVQIGRAPVAVAEAVVIDDREAILYNARALDRLDAEAGTGWAAVSVIAHELGHHYYGHAELGLTGVAAGDVLRCELDADYFSGYALGRVGASLGDAQAAQRAPIAADSAWHPPTAERLRAIEAGWRDGLGGLPLAKVPSCRTDSAGPGPCDAALPAVAPLTVETGRW